MPPICQKCCHLPTATHATFSTSLRNPTSHTHHRLYRRKLRQSRSSIPGHNDATPLLLLASVAPNCTRSLVVRRGLLAPPRLLSNDALPRPSFVPRGIGSWSAAVARNLDVSNAGRRLPSRQHWNTNPPLAASRSGVRQRLLSPHSRTTTRNAQHPLRGTGIELQCSWLRLL